jgi:hypothetical protein
VGLGEDFRGWKIGGAYYFADNREEIYVVSTEDEVAIPVYQDDNVPVYIRFVSNEGEDIDLEENYEIEDSDKYYGHMIHLPAPRNIAGFVGWYSKGYVFPAGYMYVITDVDTEFTAMFERDGDHPDVQTDCRRLTIEPDKLNILHGNVYTIENTPSMFLYVPLWVKNWDAQIQSSNGDYTNEDITVRIDFGDSLDRVIAHAGETVELPLPVYDE